MKEEKEEEKKGKINRTQTALQLIKLVIFQYWKIVLKNDIDNRITF